MITRLYNPCLDIETKSLAFLYRGKDRQIIDLVVEQSNGLFDGVKTVYIDNVKNNFAFEFMSNDTGQKVTCPANKQGYFPILTGDVKFSCTAINADSDIIVNLQLLNYEMSLGVF